MEQAALPGAAWERLVYGSDQATGAIGRHEQRITQPATLHVLDEGLDALGVFLGARRQVQEVLLAI